MGPCIVGIGASAGGLEPIREFLRAMPSNSGLAFVVIQHLDPTHKSLAAELLGKCTAMTVQEAEDGVMLKPNHVYTLPPNKYLYVRDGILQLRAPTESRGHRLPIDLFFRSLGQDQRQKAVGVVLSGSGSDGAIGLKSIVDNGGIVLVQDPQAAQFDGMPLSAISTGLATYVLPVKDMPEVIIRYASHPYSEGSGALSAGAQSGPESLAAVLALVRGRSGYDFTGYKEPTLIRRIHRRMDLRRVKSLVEYGRLLNKEPEEIDALFKDMLIGVTEFFRDPEAWEELTTRVIKPLVAGKLPNAPIRVWVAGTATGEEAYSIAMLLLEWLRAEKKQCPVQIFASDTNEGSLTFARAGVYPEGIAAQISPERLKAFFVELKDEHRYQVSEALRSAVVFGAHNLFLDPPFSKLDLVCCRNLLIYVEPRLQNRAMRLFHFALLPGGHLFLGSAETVGQQAQFKPVSEKWRIFQRVGPNSREPLDLLPGSSRHAVVSAGYTSPRTIARTSTAVGLAQRLILDRFAPAAVLINASFEVVYFCGPTDRYLTQPTGMPTQDVLTLVREGLRSRVRSAVREALRSSLTVVVGDARVRRERGFDSVRLSVIPAGDKFHQDLLLLVFEDVPGEVLPRASGGGRESLVMQLEEELRVTREDLHNTIEQLELSAEDMKVSNEEITSINEELQSINEELESSKEEMQSLNEELNTVNQQLRSKVGEIEASNRDLANLLASSDIASIRLDHEFRIRWFSPATAKVFNIIDADVGRSIADLVPIVPGAELIADVRAVLKRHKILETQQHTDKGRWYLRRIMPLYNELKTIEGVIVTFADITEIKHRNQEALVARTRHADLLEDAVRVRTNQLRSMLIDLNMAEERERRSISRELHDGPAQLLALANLKLSSLDKKDMPSESIGALNNALELIIQADKALRSLMFQISPPILYEMGLVKALYWLADNMRSAYGLKVEMHDDGKIQPLESLVEVIVFRAVRELLINVSKHAGAEAAVVDIRQEDDHIEISVSDSGVGFDQGVAGAELMATGFGLANVRERIAFLDGDFHVESKRGDGTTALLRLPLRGGGSQFRQRSMRKE